MAVRAGWGYLTIDYAKPAFVIDIGLSGPILGATLRMQQLMPTLRPGDRVDVLYDEAIANDIQPRTT